MNNCALRNNQSQVLADQLEDLLPRITEEEKRKVADSLLAKLKRCKPKPGHTWGQLYTTNEEDKLLNILFKLAWGKPTPKPHKGSG